MAAINDQFNQLANSNADLPRSPGGKGMLKNAARFQKQYNKDDLNMDQFYRVMGEFYGNDQPRHVSPTKRLMQQKEIIEMEYEQLNRELKSNTEYNMKQYLEEKKRIRAMTGMTDSIPDEIAEVIGESSSLKNEKIAQTAVTVQL